MSAERKGLLGRRALLGAPIAASAIFALVIFVGPTTSQSATPPSAEFGARLFDAHCSSCHGADGSGDTPVGKAMNVPSIKSTSLSADAMVKFVQESDKHKMAAGKLSAEELADLLAYLVSLKG